jgi:hypothetical protein
VEADAAFVAAMEDVLAVYQRPPDPARPVVCFDESGKELRDHARPVVPPRPGQPQRVDSEYRRQGSSNLFLWTAPLLGRRAVWATERRTAVDFAQAMRRLVEEDFPEAEMIVLVLDNLNTHSKAALYQAYPAEVARRIAAKLEVHYTPKHGSWLNIAECELSVLSRQCLDRRIASGAELETEVAAWAAARNARQIGVDWQFTTADSRVRLKRLYPIPVYDK